MATPTTMKVCIIGGVAAGMTAAVRLRRLREDIDIKVFEKGPDVSIASCGMPYYIGGEIKDRAKMALVNATWAKARYNIDVKIRHEVISIDRSAKQILVKDLLTGATETHSYDKLVLTPGASPVTMGIPGSDLPGVSTLRNLEDMDRITAEIGGGGRRVAVIGSGFVGVEMMENLVNKGCLVTAIDVVPQVLPVLDPEIAVPIQAAMENRGVTLRLGRKVMAIKPVTGGAERSFVVQLDDGSEVPAEFIILSIGVAAESKLAKEAGLQLGVGGTIAVDDRMRTSDPDIYAAGDAVQVINKITQMPMNLALAGPAVRQGRIIAANIAGHGDESFGGVIGTSVVKAFGITCAVVGCSEKYAKRCKLADVSKLYLFQPNKVEWFPGSSPLLVKFLYTAKEGKIIGCQITGREGVEKRIDILSVAIQSGMTVRQLSQVELAYAPQFNGPKDPVNICGMVACNVLDGLSDLCFADSIPEGSVILDVREAPELNVQGAVPGALHIPSTQIRGRLTEIPKDKTIVVMCKVGARGNFVMRMLKQNGFRAVNLSGGMMVYNLFHNPAAYKAFISNGIF